eukprot:1815576-Ditylum_brightwellii.AAC.1
MKLGRQSQIAASVKGCYECMLPESPLLFAWVSLWWEAVPSILCCNVSQRRNFKEEAAMVK